MNANPALRWGPGDFEPDDTSARDAAVARASEEIAADAERVRELVTDNTDSEACPVFEPSACAELLVTLRDLRDVFARLTAGDTLDEATKSPDDSQHFRALMRVAKAADSWIAGLIEEAADDSVIEADARAFEDRGENLADSLNGGW